MQLIFVESMKGQVVFKGHLRSTSLDFAVLTIGCHLQVDSTLKKSGEYVDSSKKVLSSKVNSQKDLHHDNLKWFEEARGKCLGSIESTIDFLKKEGIQGTAKTAVGLVLNALEDAKKVPAYLGKESQVRADGCCVLLPILPRYLRSPSSGLTPLCFAGSGASRERGLRQAADLPCR